MEQSYKEKYEQAIERLKQWDREHPCAGYVLSDSDKFIFPELAESEDEKIKKRITLCLEECVHSDVIRDYEKDECIAWLEKQGQVKESAISQHEIETCKENNNSLTSEDEKVRKALIKLFEIENLKRYVLVDGIDIEDVLGWLERQGEHANFRNKIQVGDKVTRNEDGVLVNISQLRRVAKPSEKQGEKKFEMKTAEESLGIDSDTYNKIVDECIFGEQKTKENKGNIGGISPTWSEEDEQHIDSLLKRLDALCRNKFERTRFAISEDRDWIKSLRPQNRWKPSEDDIIILEKLIKGELEPKVFQATLQGILEQLKKLKEGKV